MDETHTPTFALLLKRHSHTFALLLKRHFCTFALYANWWKVRKCESARESLQQKCNSAPRCLLTHFCFCTFVEETLSHFCTFALLLKRFPRTFALSLKRLRRTFALLNFKQTQSENCWCKSAKVQNYKSAKVQKRKSAKVQKCKSAKVQESLSNKPAKVHQGDF